MGLLGVSSSAPIIMVIMIMNKSPSSLPGGHFTSFMLLCIWNPYRCQSGLSVWSIVNDNKRIKTRMHSNIAAWRASSTGKGEVLQYVWIEKSLAFPFLCSVLRLKHQSICCTFVLFLEVSPTVPQWVCTLDKNFWAFTVNLLTGTDDLFQSSLRSSVMVLQEQLCAAYFPRRPSSLAHIVSNPGRNNR